MIGIKKTTIFLTVVFLSLNKVNALSASSVVAMDLTSKRVLYSENMDEKKLIASITKIMTCIVAIENYDIEKQVIIGNEVLKAYGSAIYIEVGEKILFKDLLYGLMLRSGNDAAIAIAYNVAGDMPSFVNLMNNKAKELGMKNTTFVNSHGLEESDGSGNTSTAYDMALLTSYAYQNETFKEIFGTKSIVVKSDKKSYSWKNKNKILHSYDFVTGGKTGYTKKAKRTLVTTGEKDNKKIVIVTINDPNDFSDHISLYQSLFKKYNAIPILNKDSFMLDECNDCYIKNNYYALLKNDEKSKLRVEKSLENNIKSEYAGQIRVYLDNRLLHEEIIYKKMNKGKNQHQNFWGKIMDWIRSW